MRKYKRITTFKQIKLISQIPNQLQYMKQKQKKFNPQIENKNKNN